MATRLRDLSTNSSEGTRTLASRWKSLFHRPSLVFVAGALTVAMVAAWLASACCAPSSAEQLLAQAYTAKTHYGIAHLRCEVRSAGELSAAQQDQQRTNRRHCWTLGPDFPRTEGHPNDPKWLQAEARADLLEFHYTSAIETLQRRFDLLSRFPFADDRHGERLLPEGSRQQ